jgi:hypothetical protein
MRFRFARTYVLVIGIMLLAPVVFAQPVGTPTSHFLFDQPAPDLATAQAYVYKLYADGSTTGQNLLAVTCVAGPSAGVQTCKAPFPAFTPGTHSITLSATNAAGEGARSVPFAFTLVAVPGVPGNIRIGAGG